MGLQGQVSAGVGTDANGDPGAFAAGDDDTFGFGDQPQQFAGRCFQGEFSGDGDDADVLHDLSPGGRNLTGQRQLGAQWVLAGRGIRGHAHGDLVLAVPASQQFKRHLAATGLPAAWVEQVHGPSDAGITAVAGHGQSQVHRLAGTGRECLRVKVCDGGQSAQRCGAAIVQPIARVERLGGLAVRGKLGAIRTHHRRDVKPGRHGGDLIAV